MKRDFFLCIAFILFAGPIIAGDLDKAFKYINTGDYDKALQNIREELSDNSKNVAANFAMAKLCSSKDYKKYNLDSATIYINKAFAAIPLKEDDKAGKKYLKLGVRDFTIKELYDEINKAAYDKAHAVNSFESFDHFLRYSKDAELNTKAIDQRDDIRYAEIKVKEDVNALKEFLNNYPKSKKYTEANKMYEELLYKAMTKPNTYQSYKEYIDKYPTGPFSKEAQSNYDRLLYESYIRKNSLNDYVAFQKDYPKSPFMGAVQDSIYMLSTSGAVAADYNNFIKTYPGNRNVIEAWNRLYDIYTSNAADSEYAFFEKIYPDYPVKERLQQDKYLASLKLAPYKSNELYGYVNTATQTLVIQPQYAEAYDFSDGLAPVALHACGDSCLYSYIDKTGKVVFDRTFTSPGDFDHGRAIVATDWCDGDPCRYGIINRRGEFVLSPIYADLQPASEGLLVASMSDKYGYIDMAGRIVVPFSYDDATSFSEGAAAVERDSVWQYIDHSGRPLFAKSFRNVTDFSSGLAAVTVNDSTYGYIDKTGEWAILPTFEYAEPFVNDTAIVTIKDMNKRSKEYGLSLRYKIDKTGKSAYKLVNPNTAVNQKSKKRKKK